MYVVAALAVYGFGFMSGSIMMAKTNDEKLQDLALEWEDKLANAKAKAKPKAKRKPRAKKS